MKIKPLPSLEYLKECFEYETKINNNGENNWLGYFDTIEEASLSIPESIIKTSW
jgi:hypothetical protein